MATAARHGPATGGPSRLVARESAGEHRGSRRNQAARHGIRKLRTVPPAQAHHLVQQQAASVPGHVAPTPQRPHKRGPLPGLRPPLQQREGEGSSGSPLPPPLRNRPRPGLGARARWARA